MHLEVYAASAVAVATVASSSASALALATSGSCVVQNCSAQSRSWSAMHRSAERVKMLQSPRGLQLTPSSFQRQTALRSSSSRLRRSCMTPQPTEVQKLKRQSAPSVGSVMMRMSS